MPITGALRRMVWVAAGPEVSPGAGSIDSQIVKGAEVGGARGYDGGKKLPSRVRHIVLVAAAKADDGTTAPRILAKQTAEHRSRLGEVWADGKYYNHRA